VLRNLEAEFGDLRVGEITPRQIDAYLNRRRREGLTNATCNRYLAAPKTLYKTARIWGYGGLLLLIAVPLYATASLLGKHMGGAFKASGWLNAS
jgi:hypothetical protein